MVASKYLYDPVILWCRLIDRSDRPSINGFGYGPNQQPQDHIVVTNHNCPYIVGWRAQNWTQLSHILISGHFSSLVDSLGDWIPSTMTPFNLIR